MGSQLWKSRENLGIFGLKLQDFGGFFGGNINSGIPEKNLGILGENLGIWGVFLGRNRGILAGKILGIWGSNFGIWGFLGSKIPKFGKNQGIFCDRTLGFGVVFWGGKNPGIFGNKTLKFGVFWDQNLEFLRKSGNLWGVFLGLNRWDFGDLLLLLLLVIDY